MRRGPGMERPGPLETRRRVGLQGAQSSLVQGPESDTRGIALQPTPLHPPLQEPSQPQDAPAPAPSPCRGLPSPGMPLTSPWTDCRKRGALRPLHLSLTPDTLGGSGGHRLHPASELPAAPAMAEHQSKDGRMEAATRGGSHLQAAAQTPPRPGPPSAPPQPPKEGHQEGLVELPASFRELITFFCTNATIHGAIHLVCSRGNRLKTTSWGLLSLGALVALCWQLGLLFERHWHRPVLMAVSVHSERKLLPLVTLCDGNPRRPSPVLRHLELLDEFARENIDALYSVNFSKGRAALSAAVPRREPHFHLDQEIRLQRLSHSGSRVRVGFRLCNSTGGDCFYRSYASGVAAVQDWYHFHYVDILALLPAAWEDSHGSQDDHFVLSCSYDGTDCQARQFRTFHHPTYGSCYTVDGIWTAQRPGITHGVGLVLRVEQQPHLPLLSTRAGIKVMVHGRNHTPFLGHHSFSIRPGTEATISIREDEVHRLGSPYGHCMAGREGVEVELLYNTSYTRQACLVSCFQQLMVETCSCGYYLHPLPAGAEYCSSARHPAWGHCFYRLYQDLETHRLPCTSRCPRPCRESAFKLSTGTSRWPSAKSAGWTLAALGEQGLPRQSHRQRSNLAKVNIVYQELNYRSVEEAPVYSVPQLLSAMGSLCSLWFGASVLSLLELLELLLDASALTLLLGGRRLHRAWFSWPRASPASGASTIKPEASQMPTPAGGTSDHLGPSRPHLPRMMLPGVLARVSAEESWAGTQPLETLDT
ncbi:amiloride-sensitive sodium channel subunit delta [Symphalangus syndactylus]|uniref:amiloride-sensitive sodium channel subunit delta n=1 Tax=Symphalangus syndactylus TaxID=9590 RepID=UPI0024430A7A|nr:amiloride-sensitive sodium channel subunit delta [Symphalangus syndactylus]